MRVQSVTEKCPRTALTAGGWPTLDWRVDVAQRTCSVEGCDRGGRFKRGWCSMHYSRWKAHGDPLVKLRGDGKPCVVEGCERPPVGQHLCSTHYSRWKQYGDPTFYPLAAPVPCEGCAAMIVRASSSQKLCRDCAKVSERDAQRRRAAERRQVVRCVNCGDVIHRQGASAQKWCRACRTARQRFYRERIVARDPEYFRDQNRKWHLDNPDKSYAIAARGRLRRVARLRQTVCIPYNGWSVFVRDGWVCQLCGMPIDPAVRWPDGMSKSIDHIVPLSKYGHDALYNVQAAHLMCNVSKSDRVGGQC